MAFTQWDPRNQWEGKDGENQAHMLELQAGRSLTEHLGTSVAEPSHNSKQQKGLTLWKLHVQPEERPHDLQPIHSPLCFQGSNGPHGNPGRPGTPGVKVCHHISTTAYRRVVVVHKELMFWVFCMSSRFSCCYQQRRNICFLSAANFGLKSTAWLQSGSSWFQLPTPAQLQSCRWCWTKPHNSHRPLKSWENILDTCEVESNQTDPGPAQLDLLCFRKQNDNKLNLVLNMSQKQDVPFKAPI